MEMRKIVCRYRQAFAECNAGDQNVYFADQQAALSKVSPDVSGNDGRVMGKGDDPMGQAKLLEARELRGGTDGFQTTRIFVVAKFCKGQLPVLLDVQRNVGRNLWMLFVQQ